MEKIERILKKSLKYFKEPYKKMFEREFGILLKYFAEILKNFKINVYGVSKNFKKFWENFVKNF